MKVVPYWVYEGLAVLGVSVTAFSLGAQSAGDWDRWWLQVVTLFGVGLSATAVLGAYLNRGC